MSWHIDDTTLARYVAGGTTAAVAASAEAHLTTCADCRARLTPQLDTGRLDAIWHGVEHGDLAGALDRLSPELRAVVQATVLDGLSTREAGRLLGIPQGTVKTRMMRARTELRGALA